MNLSKHPIKFRCCSILLSALLFVMCISSCTLIPYQSAEGVNDNYTDEQLRVHFLDVGQGDSIFVELPDKKTLLIDAGEKSCGEGVSDYINARGFDTVDYLVATHPHSDHIGGMAYIVDNMNIGSVFMPRVSSNTKTYENLLESIYDKDLKITCARAGCVISENSSYKIEVLAPDVIDEDNLNNCSAVIKLECGNAEFLFMGDAENEEIENINADLSCDVLKVGHHGSETSTSLEFIERANPDYAVISVGADNGYGHPDKYVCDLLSQFGCEVYRTDIDKTIVFSYDGNLIKVENGEN